jgi:hypothetical protein
MARPAFYGTVLLNEMRGCYRSVLLFLRWFTSDHVQRRRLGPANTWEHLSSLDPQLTCRLGNLIARECAPLRHDYEGETWEEAGRRKWTHRGQVRTQDVHRCLGAAARSCFQASSSAPPWNRTATIGMQWRISRHQHTAATSTAGVRPGNWLVSCLTISK